MTHPTASLPNDVYFNGLLAADAQTLSFVYHEFRPAIVRAVIHAGGTASEGGDCFHVALLHLADLARQQSIGVDAPFFPKLKALALAHYHHKAGEAILEPTAEDEPSASPSPEELEAALPELSPEDLAWARQKQAAWKHFAALDAKTQGELLEWAALPPLTGDPTQHGGWQSQAVEQYRNLLQIDPGDPDLPTWALDALRDSEGYKLWQAAQGMESRLEAGLPIVETAPRQDTRERYLRWAAVALLLLTLGWMFFRGRTPAKVYKDHFAPPTSIYEDLQRRYGPDLALDSLTPRPTACTEMFRRADLHYKDKNYAAAAAILEEISLFADPLCSSDACFYLGLCSLEMNDPGYTLAYFAKIEDLERYGEDIYWYQALAFVKIAGARPDMQEKAVRAIERARSNTQNPERKQAAEDMLRKLNGDNGIN